MHGKLRTDDTAVSPVVGVILLIAITVLLASTAGAMFLGITADNQPEPPQAAFGFDYDAGSDDELTVRHRSGDRIEAENLQVVVIEAEDASGNDLTIRESWPDLASGSPDEVTAGVSVTVDSGDVAAGTLDLGGATARVVWEDPNNGQTFTLTDWEAGR